MTSIFSRTLEEVYQHIDEMMAQLKLEVKQDRYDKYMRSEEWQIIRDVKLACASHKCEACGYGEYEDQTDTLDVHHLTYDRFGGDEYMTDLKVLCRPCHEAAHGRKF
jgi:5-methylcytosine-specific restriction endonuclease McrA